MKIFAFSVLAVILHFPALAQDAAPGSVLSSSGGRYVFGQVSKARRDQFMLDTQTGRLWTMVCLKIGKESGQCDVESLSPIGYQDNDGRYLPPK